MQPPPSGPARATALCVALVTSPCAASELTIDGVQDAQVPFGGAALVELVGGPGLPAFVFFDASPGPIPFGDEEIPLGLTPALTQLVAGTSDGAGSLTATAFLPANPSLVGAVVYMAGALIDPLDPNGLDLSNGASLTVTSVVGAGADFVGFVGERYALDGSGALDLDQQLPPGLSAFWELTATPPGSLASLDDPDSPFASIVPDLAGHYEARLTVSGAGTVVSDDVAFDVYELTGANLVEGTFLPINLLDYSATLVGPDLAGVELEIAGQSVGVGAGGQVGPVFLALPQFGEFAAVWTELTATDGRAARRRSTLGIGASQPVAGGAPLGAAIHLRQSGVDSIAVLGEQALQAVDPATFLLAIPPTQIANNEDPLFGFTFFSATVKFLGLSYDPNVDFDLLLDPGGLRGFVTLDDVVADFRVFGEVLEIDYDLTGTITSSPVEMTGLLGLDVVGGKVDTTLSQVDVVRNNFTFDLDGFTGSIAELFVIESFVKDEVENAVAQAIADELPAAVEDVLNGYELSLDLFELFGVDAGLSADFASVQTAGDGITLFLDGDSTVCTSEPGAPVVSSFFGSGTTTPAFGATTPTGQPYGAATALGEAFLNLVLATTTGAGLLDGDLTELLDPSLLDPGAKPGGDEDLTAGALDVLFPGAGFDRFPEDTVVDLRSSGSMAPVVRATPGGPQLGEITLAGLDVVLEVPGQDAPVPVLRLVLDARAALGLSIGAEGTLEASLSDEFVVLAAEAAFPGSDLEILQIGIDFLSAFLLPQLTAALGQIPLPSLSAVGFALLPTEVAPIGPELDYAGFFGDLGPAPPESR